MITYNDVPYKLLPDGSVMRYATQSLGDSGEMHTGWWPYGETRPLYGPVYAALIRDAYARKQDLPIPMDGVRGAVAEILEIVAKEGLDQPRDLDVALDAILCLLGDAVEKAGKYEDLCS